MSVLDLSALRRKVVAHQSEGECSYCDGQFADIVRATFEALGYEKVWNCEVFTSGYHNGCKCTADDPHGGWNCRYVWKGVSLTYRGAVKYGLQESGVPA
jgi:hypothetical protein